MWLTSWDGRTPLITLNPRACDADLQQYRDVKPPVDQVHSEDRLSPCDCSIAVPRDDIHFDEQPTRTLLPHRVGEAVGCQQQAQV